MNCAVLRYPRSLTEPFHRIQMLSVRRRGTAKHLSRQLVTVSLPPFVNLATLCVTSGWCHHSSYIRACVCVCVCARARVCVYICISFCQGLSICWSRPVDYKPVTDSSINPCNCLVCYWHVTKTSLNLPSESFRSLCFELIIFFTSTSYRMFRDYVFIFSKHKLKTLSKARAVCTFVIWHIAIIVL